MVVSPDDPRLREADAAASSGRFVDAQAMLAVLTNEYPRSVDLWIKLAAMRRASGDIDGALDAVSHALGCDPTAFLPLMIKASLLDAKGATEEAGLTYGFALFHAPAPETLPAALRQQLDQARVRHEAFLAARNAVLVGAQASIEERLEPVEIRRLDRFRTNILRNTAVFHSEPTHFHYPGLVEREFHDREDFPWLAELEAATDAIAAEFAAVAAAERAELVPYIQYDEDEPLRQWRALNHSRDWTAIHLLQNGRVIEANARHCPNTMAALAAIPQPRVGGCSPNAMFSLLAPGTTIPPHTGVANTRLVCHLPLVVPGGCWFRVGAETRFWRRGEAFVFDDTIEHEAANPSEALRVVFIIDVWHPGLSAGEREGVRLLMEANASGGAQPL